MAFLPVNPLLTENGALAALVPKFGEEKAKPVMLEASDLNDLYKSFRVVQSDMSVSVASNLKVGTIFGGNLDYNSRAFYFDAVAYTDKYERQQLGDKVISATRWGIGLRILLSITKISTDFNFSFPQITAAVQLGKASARYEIIGLGLGIEGLTTVLDNISVIADFSYDFYASINDKIIPKLSKYIAANKATLTPQPIAVELIEPLTIDALTYGHSVAFAVGRIGRKKSLKQALVEAGEEFDVEVVKDVYRTIVGDVPQNDEPSDNAVGRARQWLNVLK